jgi:glycosyltransferase involved in cell wall biosynthesis
VEIAKKYNAQVHVVPNEKIFHVNKQKAIDLATADWILQLDADERLTPELKNEINQLLSKTTYDGFWIPRKNFFLGKFLMKGGVYPDYTLRLYRKGKGRLPQKDVHEQAAVEGKAGFIQNPLLHMSDTSLARYFLRFNRYTDLLATQLKAQKQSKNLVFFVSNIFLKPLHWFLLTYIRHKGFMDSWQGLVFSILSSLRFPVAYFKYLRL